MSSETAPAETAPADVIGSLVRQLTDELRQRMEVSAPGGLVNNGVVIGGQHLTAGGPEKDDPAPAHGPVRARDLAVRRRRFVRPAAFDAGLSVLETGVLLLAGAPGTGRFTTALNLLAEGHADPRLCQVDGAVDLARWQPSRDRVDGYLVMAPSRSLDLRPWELARLEDRLARAEARMVVVVPRSPGQSGPPRADFSAQVVHHEPPDSAAVFGAHLADLCPARDRRERLLRSLGAEFTSALLPAGLPPRYAARAAEAVVRLSAGGGASHAIVAADLARAEASALMARADGDPEVLSLVLALCVFGGLDRAVIEDRAGALLTLVSVERQRTDDGRSSTSAPADTGGSGRRPLPELFRSVGAGCGPPESGRSGGATGFFWPAVADGVWDAVCGEYAGLLPVLHAWLGGTGTDAEAVDRAGRAAARIAVRTGGRTLELLGGPALFTSPGSVLVAAHALGAATLDPASAESAYRVLRKWSEDPGTAPRTAVAYACRSGTGGLPAGRALVLLHRLTAGPYGGAALAPAVVDTVVERFATGGDADRTSIVHDLADWARGEDSAALVAALAVPALLEAGRDWFRARLLADRPTRECVGELVGHALDETAGHGPMRAALLAWCGEAARTGQGADALDELFGQLLETGRPGFLLLLLWFGRSEDTTPGKDLAERHLKTWRERTPALDTSTRHDG
ncbi:hypothetical protein [Streptomyces lichenis]|uniref:ATP-binding protein n=1 Tax=Streptomyces lichenis TaxID=2306967 RepID=A0ABT0I753_9ACTN|nr:hypothetical protein [Streptomyces lichenis]MCK8677139.1 hypothetical protein [Streptomyces lichenis]